jgi:hypothetical protein
MTNYYLITTFVVLLVGAEAADKAQSHVQHLPNQGVVASREGRLAHQRSGGLGRDMRVVGIHGVQCHLRVDPAQLMKQGIGKPLRGGRSRPQDLEASTIHSLSLLKFFVLTCL